MMLLRLAVCVVISRVCLAKYKNGDSHFKAIPNRFIRIYDEWFISSYYEERHVKSIPLSVNQKNKFRLNLKARLPEIEERRVERVDILIEFHNVSKSRKGMNGTFHAQIVPKDSRISGKTQEESGRRVRKSLVEMSFDVTDLLRSHLELGQKSFFVRMGLKREGRNKTQASLGGDAKAFLLFYGNDEDDTTPAVDSTTTTAPMVVPKRSTSGRVPKLVKKKEHGSEYVGGNNKFYPVWDFSPRLGNYGITCGLQQWRVPSSDLGLFNLEAVYPQYIDVNKCQGGCYRKRKPPKGRQDLGPYLRALTRSACCVPSVLKPQLVIVHSKGFYKFVMIDALIAEKCVCV